MSTNIGWGEEDPRCSAVRLLLEGNLCFRSSGRGDQPIYQYRDGTGQQYGASHGHGVADGSQTILVGADLKRFFVPLYVGHKGWIGMRLDNKVDWQEVAEIVKRSYRMTASKKAG